MLNPSAPGRATASLWLFHNAVGTRNGGPERLVAISEIPAGSDGACGGDPSKLAALEDDDVLAGSSTCELVVDGGRCSESVMDLEVEFDGVGVEEPEGLAEGRA